LTDFEGMNSMPERRLILFGLNGIAGLLSFAMLGFGLYSAWGIDVRFNPVPSALYYILPIASFPVFAIGFVWRKAAIVQAAMALVYLLVCTILDRRTCSSLGYCAGVTSTIFLALKTQPVLAFFATAIASLAAMLTLPTQSGRPEQSA
jgi:hypothetical protein